MEKEPLRRLPENFAKPGAEKIPRQLGENRRMTNLDLVDYYGNPVQADGDREALSKPEIAQG